MIYTRDGFFFCSLIFQLEFLISFNYFPLCSCCFLFQCNFVFWFVYLWFTPHTITRHVACEWFLFCNTSPFSTYQLKHIKGHYTIIMWSRIYLQLFVVNFCVFFVKSNEISEDNSMSREKKICKLRWSEVSCPFLITWHLISIPVNVFQVVRFKNNACTGTDNANSNGTCYSAAECSTRGGSNVGSCAGGYGVCCSCKFFENLNEIFKKIFFAF